MSDIQEKSQKLWGSSPFGYISFTFDPRVVEADSTISDEIYEEAHAILEELIEFDKQVIEEEKHEKNKKNKEERLELLSHHPLAKEGRRWRQNSKKNCERNRRIL